MSESYKSHYSCMEICSSKRGKKEMSRSAPTFDAARSLVKYSILLLPKGAKEKGVFGLAVYHSGSYWW